MKGVQRVSESAVSDSLEMLHMLHIYGIISFVNGSGWVPVGSPVFKIGGGSRCGPQWVRLPSTPALILRLFDVLCDQTLFVHGLHGFTLKGTMIRTPCRYGVNPKKNPHNPCTAPHNISESQF